MNTKTNLKSGLESRSEQSTTGKPSLQPIDFSRRRLNRSLDTEALLNLMRANAPRFFELAEVVGKWVWIQFADKQPSAITSQLSELGFHWNRSRRAWQHPCGLARREPASFDPRKFYRSYFAADVLPP
jgi:hypothetical protein